MSSGQPSTEHNSGRPDVSKSSVSASGKRMRVGERHVIVRWREEVDRSPHGSARPEHRARFGDDRVVPDVDRPGGLVRILGELDALIVIAKAIVPNQAHAAADPDCIAAVDWVLDQVVMYVGPLGANDRSGLVPMCVDRMRDLIEGNVVVSEDVSRRSVGSDGVPTQSKARILDEGRKSRAKRLRRRLEDIDPSHFDSVPQIVDDRVEQVLEGTVVHDSRARPSGDGATGPDSGATGAREGTMVHPKVGSVCDVDADLAAVGKLSEVRIDVGKTLEPKSGDPNLRVARGLDHWVDRVVNRPKEDRRVTGSLQGDSVVPDHHRAIHLISPGRDDHRPGAAQFVKRSLNRLLSLIANDDHLRRSGPGNAQTCGSNEIPRHPSCPHRSLGHGIPSNTSLSREADRRSSRAEWRPSLERRVAEATSEWHRWVLMSLIAC